MIVSSFTSDERLTRFHLTLREYFSSRSAGPYSITAVRTRFRLVVRPARFRGRLKSSVIYSLYSAGAETNAIITNGKKDNRIRFSWSPALAGPASAPAAVCQTDECPSSLSTTSSTVYEGGGGSEAQLFSDCFVKQIID